MTDTMKTVARMALATLLAGAPIATYAEIETGSPQQAVAEDPNETVGNCDTEDCVEGSLEGTATATQQGNDALVSYDVDGSLVEDDAKADE